MPATARKPQADDLAFSCDVERDALNTALATVGDALARRETIPILTNVRLTAENETLTVRACDLDREVRVTVPAAGAFGDLCLPGEALKKLAAAFPAGAHIGFRADGEATACAIKSGRSRYTLATLPATDFPHLGEPGEGAAQFLIPAALLIDALDRVSFAKGTSDVEWWTKAVYLTVIGNDLFFVATDAHAVLAYCRVPLPDGLNALSGGNDPNGIIVPDTALATARKLAAGTNSENITIAVNDRLISFQAGASLLISKLAEGPYSNWRAVRDAAPHSERTATVDRAAMNAALARLGAVERGRPMVNFSPAGNGFCRVVGRGNSLGQGDEEVEAEVAEGLTFTTNRERLVECLGAFEGEHVVLDHAPPSGDGWPRPIIIRGVTGADMGTEILLSIITSAT